MGYTDLIKCRVCQGENLVPYLDLGKQPLANSFHDGKLQSPFYPLKLNVCTNCFHSQLSVIIDPKEMFSNYLYVTGTSKVLQEHFKDFAKQAVQVWNEAGGPSDYADNYSHPFVFDIAANDGTFLSYFQELGCSVEGIDAAENLCEIAKNKGITVVNGFWPEAMPVAMVDIITAANVFAHVPDPIRFLDACAFSLAENGIIVLEFPYAKNMIEWRHFDNLAYHEHIGAYLVYNFTSICPLVGLDLFHIEEGPVNGGSLRVYLKHGDGLLCKKAIDMIRKEHGARLLDWSKTYLTFQEDVDVNLRRTAKLVNHARFQGKRIVAYGASAKSATLLNYKDDIHVDYFVDDNELKVGLFSPGRSIEIKHSDYLTDEKNDVCFLLSAWNFAPSIIEKIKALRPPEAVNDDSVVTYIPRAEIRDLYDEI